MKPKLLNGDMTRAVLAGIKTQTRVPMKGLSGEWIYSGPNDKGDHLFVPADWQLRSEGITNCTVIRKHPHQVGDILYVREKWRVNAVGYYCKEHNNRKSVHVEYIGGDQWFCVNDKDLEQAYRYYDKHEGDNYSPNIHMPKWAARIFLKVTGVGVEKIRDIRQKDIIWEGVDISCNYGMNIDHIVDGCDCVKDRFVSLWNSIYPGSWERNDFVWKTEFERTEVTK